MCAREQAVLWWLEAHPAEEQDTAPQLLQCIRLPPKQVLAELEAGELHVGDDSRRQDMLQLLKRAAAAAQRLPPPGPRRKQPTLLVAAGGHDAAWHCLRSAFLLVTRLWPCNMCCRILQDQLAWLVDT